MTEDIARKTFVNVSYSGVARIAAFAFQLVANIVLSRILSPSDFGIVGFATIFTGFLSQFSDFGLTNAVVQRPDFDDRVRRTALTLKAVIGLVLLVAAILAAPLVQLFFDNPAAVNVVRLLSLNFAINSFAFLPNVILTRELNYKALSTAGIISSMTNYLLSIILAMAGCGFWSIVFANIISSVATVVVLNRLCPATPTFGIDRIIARSLFAFGGKIFLSGFMVFLLFNFDNFIVGSVKGSSVLGYYALAFNWGALTASVLCSVALSVLFPTYVKLASDIQGLKIVYLKTLEYISFAGILANLLLYCGSEGLLVHVLGRGSAKWLPALPALKIFCFYGIARVLLEPVANVVVALGKPQVLVKANIVGAGIEVLFIYVALRTFNIEGVAAVVTIAYVAQYPIYLLFLKQELQLSAGDLFHSVHAAVISAACMVPLQVAMSILNIPGSLGGLILRVLVLAGAYVLVYGLITKWRIYREVRALMGAAKPGSLLQ